MQFPEKPTKQQKRDVKELVCRKSYAHLRACGIFVHLEGIFLSMQRKLNFIKIVYCQI
jgi:hypothetical protein